MSKDYENREHEIGIIEHIIAAVMSVNELFDSWENELYVMQWLFNQRQGVIREPLDEDVRTLVLYAISEKCEDERLYDVMKWFVNHADAGEDEMARGTRR